MYFLDIFFMIVGCDAAENYMFLDIHNWCKWLNCNWGKLPRIERFYIFLTGARLNSLIHDYVMGLKNLKWK